MIHDRAKLRRLLIAYGYFSLAAAIWNDRRICLAWQYFTVGQGQRVGILAKDKIRFCSRAFFRAAGYVAPT